MFKNLEDAEAQLWNSKCPECGYMATVGLYSVKCIVVGSCQNFDQRESDRWVSLRDELVMPMLKFPNLDGDWHDVVENDTPIADNGKGEWTYQLPRGESWQCYIGDQHTSSNGITYCVVGIDRTVDQITIAWDKRVQTSP